MLFEQHGWPESPHAVQVWAPPAAPVQISDAWHWLPWQHSAPAVPQATQVPVEQRDPLAVQ